MEIISKKMELTKMKELTKKVVILNNFSSPYISQAIIVLKDYNPRLEGRAIADAEMIVSRYIERMTKNGQPAKAVRKGKFLKVFLFAAIAAVFGICVGCLCHYLNLESM